MKKTEKQPELATALTKAPKQSLKSNDIQTLKNPKSNQVISSNLTQSNDQLQKQNAAKPTINLVSKSASSSFNPQNNLKINQNKGKIQVLLPAKPTIKQKSNQPENSHQNNDNIQIVNSPVEIKSLIVKIQKSSELEQFGKDADKIIKQDLSQINLEISAKLGSDEELLDLCAILIKIASRIRNLSWKISGKFTSENDSKQIGEFIGQCTSAFSIILDTGNTYFTDKAASSLAIGISKLSNLRIISLHIRYYEYKFPVRMTEYGNNKINNAIASLKNLVQAEYNGMDWETLTFPFYLANFVFEIKEQFQFDVERKYVLFQEMVDPIKLQLVQLQIREKEMSFILKKKGGGSSRLSQLNEAMFRRFMEQAICYSVQNLPYLTNFSNQKHFYEGSEELLKLLPFQKLIKNLTLSRQEMILKIHLFNTKLVTVFPFNPTNLLIDLLY